ncbi:cytochrome C oxidase subunit II [Paenibacillaceae bacterium WGS1546]|uniref:cytochrome C oxidase subunit II n=1 Tax=Cohnella sp. WGS1546 TaxID=3366810 RepID=UPI00372D3613
MQKKLASLLALAALALALAACGGGDTNTGAANGSPAAEEEASTEVVIKASNWDFDQEEYAVPKDVPVKLTLENLSGAHGIEVVGQDIMIRGNKSKVVTLPEGTYEVRCSIQCGAGHSKMIAKLVVS